jgi:hypothetical protein
MVSWVILQHFFNYVGYVASDGKMVVTVNWKGCGRKQS